MNPRYHDFMLFSIHITTYQDQELLKTNKVLHGIPFENLCDLLRDKDGEGTRGAGSLPTEDVLDLLEPSCVEETTEACSNDPLNNHMNSLVVVISYG